MNRPDETWIYKASNSTFLGAYETEELALDAALNADDPDPWIELVPINRPQEFAAGGRRRSWVSAPQLTIPAHWSDGPDAA
jgi:hypothetical protein